MRKFLPSVLRQLIFSGIALMLSLPIVYHLHSRYALPAPPRMGIVLLGAGWVGLWIVGGVIGAALGQRLKTRIGAGLAAFGVGLVLGGIGLSIVAPIYAELAMDNVMHAGFRAVFEQRDNLMKRRVDMEKAKATGQQTIRESLAYLPALLLFGGILIAPAFGGTTEALLSRRR